MNPLNVPAARNMNDTIYETMHILCINAVEFTPACKELDEKRDALMEAIKGKVPLRTWNDLSDLFMAYGCEYGDEMFKLGLAIGRNPALIFDLPESDV